jgi:heme a synthase
VRCPPVMLRPAPTWRTMRPAMGILTENRDARAVGIWLLICCAILFALVMVGGATRLTGSGLSIVDWRPVTGVVPPLSEQAWLAELDRYRQSPEYQLVNRGMSLGEFKAIYWWEWGHRFLARLLGLGFALPLAWFWLRRRVPQSLKLPLLGILALGALQGWLGWFMVQSGLVDVPRVSPYRLAAHLGLALVIYAAMFWLALKCLWPPRAAPPRAPGRRGAGAVLALLVVTIVSGAFVAGLRAGYLYNTFPLMGGYWLPPGLFHLEPAWLNFFENPVTAQFTHRVLGVSTLALARGGRRGRRRPAPPRAGRAGGGGVGGGRGGPPSAPPPPAREARE